jgi:cell division protein FtsZ
LAHGADRAAKAIKAAVLSPLLESNDIKGAQRVLVSVSYSDESPEYEIQMDDQTTITDFVESQIQHEARLFKYGFAIDNTLGSKVRVTVVAAKFEAPEDSVKEVIPEVNPSEEENRIAEMIQRFTKEGLNHTELRNPAFHRSTIKLYDLNTILASKYESIALDDFYGMLEEKKMV